MEKRNFKEYFLVFLKGISMGSADVIPGVSGGTIALITGIYEELIHSLSNIGIAQVKILRKEGFSAFWKSINGSFLLSLFLGIGISVLSLAKVLTFLLTQYPIAIWSFFFGLILASAFVIGKTIKKWSAWIFVFMLVGTAVSYYITIATPSLTPESNWFLFFCGMLAISAMILPGISGSFILLLLGKYAFIMDALNEKRLQIVAIFALGCITGLLSFVRVVDWLFKKYEKATLALLCGFMIGSLNKVWPWKKVLEWRINSKGEQVPFLEKSVLPEHYSANPQISLAVLFLLIAIAMVYLLEKGSKAKNA